MSVNDPADDLRRAVRRALWCGRDAHGSVPFDQKEAWRQGYDEAYRQVLRVLSAPESAEPPLVTVHSDDVDDRGRVLVTTSTGLAYRVPLEPLDLGTSGNAAHQPTEKVEPDRVQAAPSEGGAA